MTLILFLSFHVKGSRLIAMYHIVFTLSTYREYCHVRCAYRELAVEFLYDYYYQRKSEEKKK